MPTLHQLSCQLMDWEWPVFVRNSLTITPRVPPPLPPPPPPPLPTHTPHDTHAPAAPSSGLNSSCGSTSALTDRRTEPGWRVDASYSRSTRVTQRRA
jgi:hypothetical protein